MYDSASLASDGFRRMGLDPDTGREVWVRIEGAKMTVREFAPVDDLVADNHALRADLSGTRHGDGLSLAMRVPEHIFHNRVAEAMRQGDRGYLNRIMNSREFDPFRVRDGRI